jgi:short-subunit dehydrogenase
MSDNVLILGAGSGIARAMAQRLAGQGDHLLLAGRDVADLRRTAADLGIRYGRPPQVLAFDAADPAGHPDFFNRCVEACGGALDGVVLCYAVLTPQEQANADPALARQVIEVNFTSPVILLNAAGAYLARRQRGYLCVLSSVAGDRGRPSNYLYGASKAALTAYLDGLRARLYSAGVDVVTVKPGPVDTAMTWGRERLVLGASPERVAAAACRAIRWHRGTIYTPWFWRPIMALVRAIPEPIFKRMKL